jgi:hypothetical protein
VKTKIFNPIAGCDKSEIITINQPLPRHHILAAGRAKTARFSCKYFVNVGMDVSEMLARLA